MLFIIPILAKSIVEEDLSFFLIFKFSRGGRILRQDQTARGGKLTKGHECFPVFAPLCCSCSRQHLCAGSGKWRESGHAVEVLVGRIRRMGPMCGSGFSAHHWVLVGLGKSWASHGQVIGKSLVVVLSVNCTLELILRRSWRGGCVAGHREAERGNSPFASGKR